MLTIHPIHPQSDIVTTPAVQLRKTSDTSPTKIITSEKKPSKNQKHYNHLTISINF